ncbi:MAG: undecaprenyldiphospho-muramoylpentapeptide beta-N-acetylglucosaminyltransferase [Peptoniphilaceae bacterium]|nr:undecaprenyldiphospho-muramoylpentapeptide beta-N-acetylglucosaminyltransferase [Peptoniphilaceae bacterium]MDY6085765.1 undecaprenyldiphospho-muramoylpentapeptide beta-N-acetylglucosaminyltransferase [Peptoniphilaceae bacterium]
MNKRIVLTGGGSAGHVVVNLALIPALEEEGWDIAYIGSETGIERDLLSDFPRVRYHAIPTGKFRRARTWENIRRNLGDVGHVLSGVAEARRVLQRERPQVVFSKGGFVSVPVVLAARRLGIPVITHESDRTPGLANKIIIPFVKRILLTFERTADFVPRDKAYYLGPIIRQQMQGGSAREGLIRFGLDGKKPVLLVVGGSLGAAKLNRLVWQNLDPLLKQFDIVHSVGAGKGDSQMERPGYVQVDYIRAGMNDALAMADVVVSRAGSNAIFEFLYYQKPMLLIPYKVGSRGDQVENAEEFERAGYAKVLDETSVTSDQFLAAVRDLLENGERYREAMRHFTFRDGVQDILEILEIYRLQD